MSSVKQQLQEVVSALPEDCTMDEFRYRLHLRLKIEEGIQAIDDGHVSRHEEAVQIIRSRREMFGREELQK